MEQRKPFGFTLVEMLVAITIMAVMAGLSWRGLDAMSKSRASNQVHHEQVLSLSAALAQWGTDLDAVMQTPHLSAIAFDGTSMRLTRQSALHDAKSESMVVVAYGQRPIADPAAAGSRGGLQWLRWQSEPATTQAQLQARWAQAQSWSNNLSDLRQLKSALPLASIDQWTVSYYQDGQWTSASEVQTAASAPGAAPVALMPDAIRLKLTLAAGQPYAGELTRDWIRPVAGGTR
jgi:general secretion pathway protein J